MIHDSRRIRPNLLMGQHFLRSGAVLAKIIAAANLSKTDTVLEIGPGLGVLTFELARWAKEVVAVEKDKRLAALLEKKLKKERISNVRLITADILKIFPISHLSLPTSYKIVANIPYYLTGRLIRKFLTCEHPPTEMLLMVQKEVAERIIARPPKMNLLAIAVQAYAEPKILFRVPKNAFWPQPKVDSALIRISKISKRFFAAADVEESEFFAIVRAAFQGKRKTLENSLAKNLKLPKAAVSKTLSELGLLGKRPEMLGIENWIKLTHQLP